MATSERSSRPRSGPDNPVCSALEVAIALREGTTTAKEQVARSLEVIRQRDPELAAFVHVSEASAIRRADRLDRSGPPDVGPVFWGVPSGIKDLEATAFEPLRIGSRNFRYLWTPFDSPLVKQLRAGGFVMLGKLQTSELAVLPVTETDIAPPCRNPHDPSRTPGGSSGGSAAAVASGMLPIAHASDGGGSIRIPAAWCGLVGHKPSVGMLTDWFAWVDPVGMSQVNCVARTVEDSAAHLDVLQGRAYDPRDPPGDSLLARCRERPDRLRIAWCAETPLCPVDPEIAEATERVAKHLAELGHTVEAAPPMSDETEAFLPVFGHVLSRPPIFRKAWLQPATRYVRSRGAGVSRAEATRMGLALRDTVAAWFGDYDLWLLPTTAVPPPRIGEWSHPDGRTVFERVVPAGAFTAIFNIGGQAAISIPAGTTSSGLPIGVQLAAPIGRDLTALRVARELMS